MLLPENVRLNHCDEISTFHKNDNFIVFMDTYNDQTNGFAFGVSAAGAQWDGVQANGGVVNLDWDIKWRSSVKNYDDRWVAEFAIPFRSIRYNGGEKEWGINFSRLDLKSNEKSSWAPMPRQFATATLAFAGSLVWDKPLAIIRTTILINTLCISPDHTKQAQRRRIQTKS